MLRDLGPDPLGTLVNWATTKFERFLAPDQQGQRFISPRSLLVRWTFVSTQIMRDLTLRSRGEFGSFRKFVFVWSLVGWAALVVDLIGLQKSCISSLRSYLAFAVCARWRYK
jgi:hypothetical protein